MTYDEANDAERLNELRAARAYLANRAIVLQATHDEIAIGKDRTAPGEYAHALACQNRAAFCNAEIALIDERLEKAS